MKNTLPPEIESLCFLKQDDKRIPLWPYVVAVTGHRFFAKPGEVEGMPGYDRETIKNAFRKELEALAQLWKEKCNKESWWRKNKKVNAPLILLTGMADGADQLAAEVALELPPELNVKVVAVLPMEKELFRLTLTDKERFDSLLKRVYMTYALPLPDNSVEYRAKIADVDNRNTDCLRDKQYNNLGKFLALHSHVLFAFWDGIDMPNLVGGTSTVLHFKLEGNTHEQSESDLLTYTSVGPVVQFLLPRNNPENLKEPVATLENPEEVAVFYWSKRDLWDKDNKCYFFPSRKQMTEKNRCKTSVSNMKEIVDTLERIGELNWYSINCPKAVKKELSASQKYLFKEEYFENTQNKPEDFCDAETKALNDHYMYVDRLARWFKKGMERIVLAYLWGVGLFLAFGSLLSSYWEIRQNGWEKLPFFSLISNGQNTFYEMFFSGKWWTLFNWLTFCYLLSILLFIGIIGWAKCRKNRIRFYRFRAVAEALRVQIFWRIAEIDGCVSGHYRTHQLPETEWLRAAINGLDVLLEAPDKKNFNKSRTERLTFVREVWINGQLKFFKKRLDEGQKESSFFNLKSLGLVWLALIIPSPFIPTWMNSLYDWNYLYAGAGIVLYNGLLALIPILGLIIFWGEFKQPQSELDRYKQMLFPFDRAFLLMKLELEKDEPQESEDKIEELHPILLQLGTEAVSENAAWYLSLGERELTLPQ